MEKVKQILKRIKLGVVAHAIVSAFSWTFKKAKWFVEDDSLLKYVYDTVAGAGIFGFIFWLLTRDAPSGTIITKTAFIHAHAGLVALFFGLLVAGALICFDLIAAKQEKEDSTE